MPDICIIDVNLGTSVDAIIGDDLSTITAQNHAVINASIAESKALTVERERQEAAEQEVNDSLEAAYKILIGAKESGSELVRSAVLMTAVQPYIATLNSLAQRLRALLRAKGDKYKLKSMRGSGMTCYCLEETMPSQ